MPLFLNERATIPRWCEVDFFDILRLDPSAACRWDRRGIREIVFAVRGACTVLVGRDRHLVREGEWVASAAPAASIGIRDAGAGATVVRIAGHWGGSVGSCGVFELENATEPRNDGDPTEYSRTTIFDNHFHDCDEYWIITEGRCTAVSEGRTYALGPGDCLATRSGSHHDIPSVQERVRGVFFEGELKGRGRAGHLWEHRDGPAEASSA